MIGKIDILKAYVFDLKPAIVCICEACSNSSISDSYLALDGYSLIVRADGTDTKDGWCRGLLIYARLDIKAERLESSLIQDLVECEGVTIPWGVNGNLLTLLLAYRPPRPPGSVADKGYCDKFCELVASIKSPSIILGDLNLPGIDWDHLYASSEAERLVLETFQDNFWTQHIDFPTRKDPSSGKESLLDPCLSSSSDLILAVENHGLFSDHVIYSADLAWPVASACSKELVPDWGKADLDKLVANLAEVDWASELECLTGLEGWEAMKKRIDEETELCVPKKLRRVSNRPLWMTNNVMRLLRKKRRLWKAYTTSKYTQNDYNEYAAFKQVQCEVKKAVKNSKRNFERKLAKDARKSNTKPFYSYMKKRTSNRVGVGPLKNTSGKLVTDDQSMAEILNDFFCSVFTQEDSSNVPEAEQRYFGGQPLESFVISAAQVQQKLTKLKPNSAPGPDRLWPRILGRLAEVIALPLSMIYNRCLIESSVPSEWKDANVTPIFKKGSKGMAGNYRPVSLTCILCKIMESILKDGIVEHLERHNLLRDSQHGFMAGKSTLSNLLEYLEDLTRLIDQGHAVDVVYLDFAKAFDKVPHTRLIGKCDRLGIRGIILGWVREGLTGRRQRVVLNGQSSDWREVHSGVPQGSVLGPLLFLIFINDIDWAAETTGAIMKKFADDTKCYMVVESEEDRRKFQLMLDNLAEWSSLWQMSFNTDKCHVLHAGKKNQEFSYDWGSGQLAQTLQEKDVGVLIMKNLKPSLHCAKAANKANQVLGQMARAVSYRDKFTFLRLYKVYVRPHLQYCSSAWSPFSVADKEVLERVQRRAVNMICGLAGSYEQKLRELGLLTLEENRVRGDMIEMFKLMTGKSTIDFRKFFQLSSVRVGAGNTRGNSGYLNVEEPSLAKTDIRRHFFSSRCPRLWNSLPDYVKQAGTVHTFKVAYDDYVWGRRN